MTSSHDHHHHGHPDATLLPRILDLDAQVHAALLDQAFSWVALLAAETGAEQGGVRRVLDIGAGTGTGTTALAARFPSAQVVAVDVNEHMLARVRDRAASLGLLDRVETITADVGSAHPGLGTADVVWSSVAIHEVADPQRAFGNLFDALRPGGVLAVVELDAPPMVLPKRLADFEQRLRSAAGATPASHHPDWAGAIETAGFELVDRRVLVIDETLPAEGDAADYAVLELRRIGHSALPLLDDADRATLQALTGDDASGVRSLDELWIRGTRTMWAARRP